MSLMLELGVLELEVDGLKVRLREAPSILQPPDEALDEPAEPAVEDRGPDGLTPSEQEELYNRRFDP